MNTGQPNSPIYNLLTLIQLNRLLLKATDGKYDMRQRIKAIDKLGNLGRRKIFKTGKQRIVHALLLALSDEAEIRMKAAESLTKFGESQWRAVVKGTTEDFNRLAKIEDKRTTAILIRALDDFRDKEKQMATAIAMGIRDEPEFAEPLISQFSKSGLYLERNLYPLQSGPLLEVINQDGETYSQMSLGELAALSLSRLSSYDFKDNNRIILTLPKYLVEYRPETRKAIAIILSKLGEKKWLEIIEGDSQDFDRIAKSGDPNSVTILLRAMGYSDWISKPDNTRVGTTKKSTNHDAKRALGSIDNPALINSLEKARNKEMVDKREAINKALGNIGNTRAVDLLINGLKDRVKSVRLEAAKALFRIASKDFSLVADHWKSISILTIQSHQDHEEGTYEWSCEFHTDDIKHTDTGIGLEIPPELKK